MFAIIYTKYNDMVYETMALKLQTMFVTFMIYQHKEMKVSEVQRERER